MSEQILIEALNDSLDRLAAGQTIEDCLRAHANVADDLQILLEIAQATKRARPDHIELGGMRSRLDPHIDNLIENTQFPKRRFGLPPGAIVMLVASILFVFIGFFVLLPREESQAAKDLTNTAIHTPEVTEDETFTPIASVTLSETPTASASPTMTQTPSPTLTEAVTETATATLSKTPTATLSPTATMTATPSPEPTVCEPKMPDGWRSYQVQSGDALFNIALQTGTTVDTLMQVNCLNDHIIVQGQELYVPDSNQTNSDSPATQAPASSANEETAPDTSTQSSETNVQATKSSENIQATPTPDDEEYDHEDDHSDSDSSYSDSSDSESSDSS